MSDGKPNILGKLPVYNDAGEIFESGADRVQSTHKAKKQYASDTHQKTARTESRFKPSKKTDQKATEKGKDPKIGAKERPKYAGGSKKTTKTASKEGKGSGKAPAKPKPPVKQPAKKPVSQTSTKTKK